MAVSPSLAVTGLGVVCPVGLNAAQSWDALMAGQGAGEALTGESWLKLKSPRAARVPPFAPPEGMAPRDRSLQLAVLAAREAWAQAGLGHARPGVIGTTFSSSKGGLMSLLEAGEALERKEPPTGDFLREFFPCTPGTFLRELLGFQGPALSFSAACATGLASLIQAADWIERGTCEAVLAGSTESSIHPLILAGFGRMGLLTEDPAGGRPFDICRNGFLLGEGSGALVLESRDSARKRGITPLAWMTGWALGADGEGILELEPRGRSIIGVIRRALERAGLKPEDINYINAHGTGTRANDKVEAQALADVFKDHPVWVSSTKGATGHLLGAAGSVEAVFAVLALARGEAPVTRNLKTQDPECRVRHVPAGGARGNWKNVMSLSYGIGGQLGAVIFSKG
jgi:3-oxoacyl-[acyl-carrier-protein] synthase II